MSRPRFLADNDLNDALVVVVRRREPTVEIARLRDLDLATQSDPEVLDYAARENWIVISHDVNTMGEAAWTRVGGGTADERCSICSSTLTNISDNRKLDSHLGCVRRGGMGRSRRVPAALTHRAFGHPSSPSSLSLSISHFPDRPEFSWILWIRDEFHGCLDSWVSGFLWIPWGHSSRR